MVVVRAVGDLLVLLLVLVIVTDSIVSIVVIPTILRRSVRICTGNHSVVLLVVVGATILSPLVGAVLVLTLSPHLSLSVSKTLGLTHKEKYSIRRFMTHLDSSGDALTSLVAFTST